MRNFRRHKLGAILYFSKRSKRSARNAAKIQYSVEFVSQKGSHKERNNLSYDTQFYGEIAIKGSIKRLYRDVWQRSVVVILVLYINEKEVVIILVLYKNQKEVVVILVLHINQKEVVVILVLYINQKEVVVILVLYINENEVMVILVVHINEKEVGVVLVVHIKEKEVEFWWYI